MREIEFHRGLHRPGMIVDIGAHQGRLTLPLAELPLGNDTRQLSEAEAYRRPWTAAEQHLGRGQSGHAQSDVRPTELPRSRRMTWLKQRIADHREQRDGHCDH
jgi:hypothetical protein